MIPESVAATVMFDLIGNSVSADCVQKNRRTVITVV
jgi:hypothetical protein